jgi:hypothetical protein
VRSEATDGLVQEDWAKALSKSEASLAKASMFGLVSFP